MGKFHVICQCQGTTLQALPANPDSHWPCVKVRSHQMRCVAVALVRLFVGHTTAFLGQNIAHGGLGRSYARAKFLILSFIKTSCLAVFGCCREKNENKVRTEADEKLQSLIAGHKAKVQMHMLLVLTTEKAASWFLYSLLFRNYSVMLPYSK